MTIDERGRAAAEALRGRVAGIAVPEFRLAVRRRRRRQLRLAAVMAVAAVVAAVVLVPRAATPTYVTTGPGLPPGSLTADGWASVPTMAAGIDAGSELHAVAAGRTTAALAGALPSSSAAAWWSDDGLHWHRAALPAHKGPVLAVALDGDDGIAVGADPRGVANVVWRSTDGGRSWRVVSSGAVFGPPAAAMGRPFVQSLLRVGNEWVAGGGSASGTAGIWTSAAGTRWTQALDESAREGSATVVPVGGGRLLAHWATAGWFTDTPTRWGASEILGLPAGLYLRTVAPGATIAFADHFEAHGKPTPLLRSTDGGHEWREDRGFLDRFPNANVHAVDHTEGLWVAAGAAGSHVGAWVSPDATTWEPLPASIRGDPGGTLGLTATFNAKVLLFGTAPELNRFYVRGVGDLRCPGSYVIDEHSGPDGLPAADSATTDRTRVDAVAHDARRAHPQAASVGVGPGGGYVWDRDARGVVAVRSVQDYAIQIHLRRTSDCPDNPNQFYEGVPLVFLAPQP